MKNKFYLSIPKACSEKWSGFTSTAQGGFCSSCNKEVIDFTAMSDREIVDFFQRKPSHTCGRFRPDQLKSYSTTLKPEVHPGFKLFYASLISLFLIFVNSHHASAGYPSQKTQTVFVLADAYIQNTSLVQSDHIVKGYVKSEDGEPIVGANIYLKDSQEGTVSDANGYFEFPRPLKAGEVLYFSFIGFETQEYVVTENSPAEIEMKLSMQYEILGAVAVDGPALSNETFIQRMWTAFKNLF